MDSSDKMKTSLREIRRKVLAYHRKMNGIAKFLKDSKAPAALQLDTSKEFMEFYIEKEDLLHLIRIALLPGFEKFAVFFGLATVDPHDNTITNSVTTCFLGIDQNYQILDQHKPSTKIKGGGIPGEDTWIPPGAKNDYSRGLKDFTLATPENEIDDHFN